LDCTPAAETISLNIEVGRRPGERVLNPQSFTVPSASSLLHSEGRETISAVLERDGLARIPAVTPGEAARVQSTFSPQQVEALLNTWRLIQGGTHVVAIDRPTEEAIEK
jgi:hypothetical protein